MDHEVVALKSELLAIVLTVVCSSSLEIKGEGTKLRKCWSKLLIPLRVPSTAWWVERGRAPPRINRVIIK